MFNNNKIGPMLLKEIPKVIKSSKYIYEVKFDGIRALIHVSKESFKIISRNGKDITNFYPELKEIQKLIKKNEKVIFDGEIIALKEGKPSFQLLQKRNHLKNITEDLENQIPVYFIAFDIIYQNKSLINLELLKRKEILNKYQDTNIFIKTKMYNDGAKLFQRIKKLNLEGIVAKEKDSLYIPNKRVDTWLKIKNIKDGEFYIHGFIFNKEKYSLFLGEKRKDGLYYVGKVSVGENNDIIKKLKALKKVKGQFINFREEGVFVEPKIQVTVTYLEKTKDGKLRHAILK